MVITSGELLLDLFEACGVEYVFCSPGTEWTPLWEGLLNRGGKINLKYINCRHEILAISAAQGYTEVTGRLPAVLLHSSVGPLMGAMAMRNALSARAPMLIFSGETCEHCGDEEVKAQGWQWLGLLSDIGGNSALVKDYVKWSSAVKTRDGLADAVLRGSQIALSAPRGPVYISVPSELLLKSAATAKIQRPVPYIVALEPSESDLRKVSKQLINGKHPIIIADHAGRNPEAAATLTRLAEMLSAPVFDTILHFSSNISSTHPLYQGQVTPEALKEADIVFVVAAAVPWYPPSAGPGDKAKIILLAEDTRHERWPYWNYRVDIAINADIAGGLAALEKLVRAEKARQKTSAALYRERLESWRQKHEEMATAMVKKALAVKANKPIATRWLLHSAKGVFLDGAIILDETILHTHILHQYLAEPGRYIKPAYGGLGVGLGAALGVKLANPLRPVILLIGDGAFNYNPVLAGLGLGQEYNLPILIIILNNGGYMAMKKGYRTLYPQGWAASHDNFIGVDIKPAPDYVKIAEAFGAFAEKLTEPEKIQSALKRGLKQIAGGRAALLDVIVDKSL
ncbi:MAG: thiamine pyrophosphate-dependent enzyme [Dehalococcoidales bacterium]